VQKVRVECGVVVVRAVEDKQCLAGGVQPDSSVSQLLSESGEAVEED